jgi:hypothetical protein
MPLWPKKPPLPFRSSAPAEWAAGKSSAARLHVRLVRAVRAADLEVANLELEVQQLVNACDGLRRSAEAIDAQLVAASRLPFARRQAALLGLRKQVDDVEATAHRVALSALEAKGLGDAAASLDEVIEGLDLLDAARRELANPSLPRATASERLAKLRRPRQLGR